MPIPKRTSKLVIAALALSTLLGAGTVAHGFDPEKVFKPNEKPRSVFRFGFRAWKQGNMADALGAFRYGAEMNDLASQWKLAHMLQTGTGVERNHYAAYKLYAKIAGQFIDHAPRRGERGLVSHAVVSLGLYSLKGIKGTAVKANPRRAEDHFYRAAALYHDPVAQDQLGKLYRHGKLGVKQPRSAARWLGLAAKKGHPDAQAELGEMLFYGEGIRRKPVRGLVYLTRAAAGSALTGDERRIRKARKEAFAEATTEERNAAEKLFKRFTKRLKSRQRLFGFGPQQLNPDAVPVSE
jgi:TPR repeat protein